MAMTKTVKCPQCGKAVKWIPESKYRPFCSERCKLIDFGAWAKEEHTIPGDPAFDDLMSQELDEVPTRH
nr:DNA gyrase inhibitor YacG [Endozoicomonas acroporae]